MGKVSDEELFHRLINGDREALRPLMECYGDSLKLYIDGYVRDIDMAEEIMIDAFSRMLVKAPRLHRGGFKPYLFKTARNLAFKHLKYRSRFTSLDVLAYEPIEEQQIDYGLLLDEQSSELYLNLDKISPEYREALYLVYIEELSYEEAAAVMHKSRKQVENLVYRGKRSMRVLMGEERDDSKAPEKRRGKPVAPLMPSQGLLSAGAGGEDA